MKLPYQAESIDQGIQLSKLRPDNSYSQLIQTRNHGLDKYLSDTGEIKPEFLTLRDCPNCKHNDTTEELHKDGQTLVRCQHCALVYVNPMLTESAYEEIYGSTQYQTVVRDLVEASHNYRRKRFGRERVSDLERFLPDTLPKSLFELGCSTGFMLQEAASRGWDVAGSELNPRAVDYAKSLDLNVQCETLDNCKLGDKQFSAIALYDVLEHLPHPAESIAQLQSHLVPGGIMAIYVPNYLSASTELLGAEHAHFIWPSQHLTYFTPETLADFFLRLGFNIVHWETQGLDIDDWLWHLEHESELDTTLITQHKALFQFYINAAGHGKNLRMFLQKV